MTPYEALAKYGSITAADKELGIPRTTLRDRLERERTRLPVTHCVIPDCQVKEGVPIEHLEWIGNYIVDKRPDVVICIGDFWDMPSLSSYDKGKKCFEGRRYRKDVEAGNNAMDLLMTPLVKADFHPRLVFTMGNHEHRISRAIDNEPILDGTIGLEDLELAKWGWEVVPFLQPIEIDGISYCHYFYNPNSGKPYAGTALSKLKNIGLSFTMGHQQGIDIAMRELPNGKTQHALVAGSCYLHDETYRGPQANGHWNGIVFKHEVQDGSYDLMQVSLDFLRRKYS
jgi:hypothetical protein